MTKNQRKIKKAFVRFLKKNKVHKEYRLKCENMKGTFTSRFNYLVRANQPGSFILASWGWKGCDITRWSQLSYKWDAELLKINHLKIKHHEN